MTLFTYNTLLVLVGVGILGASAGMMGTFAVLRRRALLGDAIAHATLPGVCLAFLIVGERHLPSLLLGAFVAGLVGILVISLLKRWSRLKEDAALGIVLSVFVGLGFVLQRIIQQNVSGGSKAGLTTYILGKTSGMIVQDVVLIGTCALMSLLLVGLLFKEFQLITFDPGFARVQGWPTQLIDLLLMGLLVATIVIGLPAVGAILMAALLIIPAATARLWTSRLSSLLALAASVGALAAIGGVLISARFERMPTGPVIVLVGTCLFLVSFFFAPERGLLAALLSQRRIRLAVEQRRLLLGLANHHRQYPAKPISAPELQHQLAVEARTIRRLLSWARQQGYLEQSANGELLLTESGVLRSRQADQHQRLWSLFVQTYPELARSLADLSEESLERLLPADLFADLKQQLEMPARPPLPTGFAAPIRTGSLTP